MYSYEGAARHARHHSRLYDTYNNSVKHCTVPKIYFLKSSDFGKIGKVVVVTLLNPWCSHIDTSWIPHRSLRVQ